MLPEHEAFPTAYLLHFLRTFLNELLGRYANLQQFIEQTSREAGGRSPELLVVFSDRVQTRIKRLVKWSRTLVDLPLDSATRSRLTSPFNFLIETSVTFQQFHRTLRWFSAPWPEAEVFQFLRRVFKENKLESLFRELNGSIVFNDEFNFVTYDVGYVSKSSPRLDLAAWALPKSERSNPLLWPVLTHEVAHSRFDEEEIFEQISEENWGGIKDQRQKDLLNRWGVELNADLFGFRLLGPAYLYALLYFSVFFIRENLRQPVVPDKVNLKVLSDMGQVVPLHPPPAVRIKLLLKEAMAARLTSGVSQRLSREGLETIRELFYSRLEFDNLNGEFDAKEFGEYLLPENNVEQLWETLKVFQGKILPERHGVTDQDVETTATLATRLDQGLLAGSIHDPGNLEIVRDYVRASAGGAKEFDWTPVEALTRENALRKLDESPARMIDIINAGWINRGTQLKKENPEARRVPGYGFVYPKDDTDEEIDSATPQILNALIEPTRQLQKSIQVALIFSSLSLDYE
jgi:hypothetical protein